MQSQRGGLDKPLSLSDEEIDQTGEPETKTEDSAGVGASCRRPLTVGELKGLILICTIGEAVAVWKGAVLQAIRMQRPWRGRGRVRLEPAVEHFVEEDAGPKQRLKALRWKIEKAFGSSGSPPPLIVKVVCWIIR